MDQGTCCWSEKVVCSYLVGFLEHLNEDRGFSGTAVLVAHCPHDKAILLHYSEADSVLLL